MRHALSCIAFLGLSACNAGTFFYDDRCGPESREVGNLELIRSTDGDSAGLVQVSLGEVREPGTAHAWWFVEGEFFRGHLESARLVAKEDTSVHLLELTGGPAEPDYIINGTLDPYTGPVDFGQLFERGAKGGFTVVLETDFPARPVIVVPLHLEWFNDWSRAHCS